MSLTNGSDVNKKITAEEFILRWKAAHAAKLTKEQLAKMLGIQADSLRRRRLTIKRELGVDLPTLASSVSNTIDQKKLEAYYAKLQTLTKASATTYKKVNNLSGYKRYVITAAQNATPPHMDFLGSILNYCEVNDARLVVIPYRYHNLRSVYSTDKREDDWWHTSLEPYICDEMVRLSDNLVLMGHLKVQPTATAPLSGLESYSGQDSAIIGHPKIELKTVPTPSKVLPKIMSSTGTITVPNYSDTKAGYKGEFHHSLAAVVVEIDDDGDFHIRHIHADDSTGEFYDLNRYYSPTSVEKIDRIAALVTGDTHAEFIDDAVKEATYTGKNSIMRVLNPEVMVYHDVEDFYSRNHHHRGNDIITFGKHHFGRDNVEESLQVTADFIDEVSDESTLNVIVKSNHDEAFDRWLREADPKMDMENARFYHYMKYHQYTNTSMTPTGFQTIDSFEFWCKNPMDKNGLLSKDRTVFLKRDQSFVVANVELGFHGDVGPNGARGSARAFSKIGPKTVIGHSHCLTGGHSVLVKGKGWIPLSDAASGDYVLSYGKDGNNEYVEITDTFKALHSGKIISVGGDKWRQEVTDYHNMYLSDHTYMPITAAIATRQAGEVPLVAGAITDSAVELTIISDDTIRRVVALCADGSIQDGRWVRFHLKKDRKIKRLKELFDGCLTPISQNSSGAYKTSLVTDSPIYTELQKYVDFSDKRLPDILKSLNARQKQIFLDELRYWDGTFATGNNGNQFTTAKKSEADIVSSVITELGYRNSCKLRWKKASAPGTYLITWSSDKENRIVSQNSRCDLDRIKNWRVKTRDVVDEPVYCVTNRNQNFWVRHDATGTVSLTGNSPCIYEGCYQVGVSARLDLEYVRGCSSWMHTHALIYPDGSRTLINVINGKWRG